MKTADLRFCFSLRPVEEIQPWGRDGSSSLSWFGLSDGWYWVDVDGQELFRAADAPTETPPYVDYQVARLWEDILEIAPDVLVDVPADIAANLRDPVGWLAAVERMVAGDDLDETLVSDGLRWWRERSLDSGHLVAAPTLWLWRTGGELNLLWRSSPRPVAVELWRPVAGFASQTVDNFVAELKRFDREFLSAMAERVESLVRQGGRQGVDIDLEQLQREQHERSTWLDHAIATSRPAGNWDAVRQLLETAAKQGLMNQSGL